MMRPEDEARVRRVFEDSLLCHVMKVMHRYEEGDADFLMQMYQHETRHYLEIVDELRAKFNFLLKMSKQDKAKIVVNFTTYAGFVLDSDKAIAIMEMLRGAERYKSNFKYDNGNSTTTVHVWPFSGDEQFVEFKYLTDEQYALAKVAGKPED